MKSIAFDSGPLITLSLNNLLWLIPLLKEKYNGNFLISESVKKELVDDPLNHTKKYILEALNILKLMTEGYLNLASTSKTKRLYTKLDHLANKAFSSNDSFIKILHSGELETIALAIAYNCEAIIIDERTTTLLIEDPKGVKERLEKKLHRKIKTDSYRIKEFQEMTKNIKVIRSSELVAVSYELGLFDKYFPKEMQELDEHFKEHLVTGLLWGVKLRGCAISEEEIAKLTKELIKKKTF